MTRQEPGPRPPVGLLHPGQMGAAVAAEAVRGGTRVLWAVAGRSEDSRRRAEQSGLDPVADLPTLLARCPVVLSICPPAAAETVAVEVARYGYRGVYVEANAVNPDRVRRIAHVLGDARVVDGSIIGPPPGNGVGARLYLAGLPDDVAPVARTFDGTCVDAVVMDREIGSASALKMAFAAYQKATRTLAAVSLALAGRHGVEGELLIEARRMAGVPLAEHDYLPGVAARAWRWAPEMLEIADTLAAAGLPDEMARAAAAVLELWQGERDRWDTPLATVLDRLVDPALLRPVGPPVMA